MRSGIVDEKAYKEQRERTKDWNRGEWISAMRTALRTRTGQAWSVTGGRGTAYGWISISKKSNRRMTEAESAALRIALGLEPAGASFGSGISIPASTDYRIEHLDRCEGRAPSVHAEPYWD